MAEVEVNMQLLAVDILEIRSRFVELYHQSLTLSWINISNDASYRHSAMGSGHQQTMINGSVE